jgi:hypothetical protein
MSTIHLAGDVGRIRDKLDAEDVVYLRVSVPTRNGPSDVFESVSVRNFLTADRFRRYGESPQERLTALSHVTTAHRQPLPISTSLRARVEELQKAYEVKSENQTKGDL